MTSLVKNKRSLSTTIAFVIGVVILGGIGVPTQKQQSSLGHKGVSLQRTFRLPLYVQEIKSRVRKSGFQKRSSEIYASVRDTAAERDETVAGMKAKALEAVMKDVNARFGSGAVMRLGDHYQHAPATISSGALTLDLALGGGWPQGRIVEIYGPESSGKTTVALHAMAQVQKKGGVAALIDAEHAFDAEYAKRLGVDVSSLILCQPDSGEMALEVVDSLARSGAVDLIAVDSVAALAPRAEIEGDIGTVTVGAQARLMSHALRKITPLAAKSNCTILFLNQIRYKIGVLYGNPEVTSGGNALKFYSSVRLEIRVKGRIEGDGELKGINVKGKVVKNKCAPPYKIAEFDIIFGQGIDSMGCLLDVSESMGVCERRGSYYYFEGNKIAQGRDNTLQVLRSNSTLEAGMRKAVDEKLTLLRAPSQDSC